MKLFKSLYSLLFVVLCSCSTNVTVPTDYDVYLLIGQSNMAGRGTLLHEDTIKTIEGVYLLNDSGKIEPAVAPLNKYSTIRKAMKYQQMCPGNSFSKIIHDKTNKPILLVVNARGGSSIKEWSPTVEGSYVYEAVKRTKQALNYGQLKGILWHQGESDSKNPSYYMDSLVNMVHFLRSELQAENVPFIAGEIAPWHSNRDKFNSVIHTIKEHVPNSDWVSSEGCTWLKGENDPHFSRDGQLLLGARYAEKIYDIVYK